MTVKALAYYRTSSAANVGDGKDSARRQAEAVKAYALKAGIEIVGEFYDAAVSGADPIDTRPGFADMLARIAGNGVRTILVESPDRFARDLMVQLTGHDMLKRMGIVLIPVSAPDHFTDDTPTAVLIRQVLGAVAQFDKAMTVAKLRGARSRKKAAAGKCEGRKSHGETAPDMVRAAHRLARKNPKNGKVRSLRQIAEELAAIGYTKPDGAPFGPQSVANMLKQRVAS